MYNGHKNWNHWNVSLWLNNDDRLYGAMMCWLKAAGGNKDRAARAFYRAMIGNDHGISETHTPDGAPYSVSSIRAAMRGH